MSTSRHTCTWWLGVATFALATLCSVALATPPTVSAATASHQDATAQFGENSVEVALPRPTRYAVILHEPEKFKTVHARGDKILHPRRAGRFLTIERLDSTSLVIRDNGKQSPRSVKAGRPIPDFPGLIFAEAVTVNTLQYRSRIVTQVEHADPVLVSVEKTRAIFEMEIVRQPGDRHSPTLEVGPQTSQEQPDSAPAQPGRRKLAPELFAEMRVEVIDANSYMLAADEVRPVLQNIGQVLSDIQPMLAPAFSARTGMSLNVSSAVADGILSQSGFTVPNPKIAERFGIQVGDSILQINGHPVNGPLNAWWTYQEVIIRNPLLTQLQIDIRRNGRLVTKTYAIR